MAQMVIIGLIEEVRPKKTGGGSYVTIKGLSSEGTDTFNFVSDDDWSDIPLMEKLRIEADVGGRVYSGEKGPNQRLYLRKVAVKPHANGNGK